MATLAKTAKAQILNKSFIKKLLIAYYLTSLNKMYEPLLFDNVSDGCKKLILVVFY